MSFLRSLFEEKRVFNTGEIEEVNNKNKERSMEHMCQQITKGFLQHGANVLHY